MLGGRVLRKRKQAESGCVAPHIQAFCTPVANQLEHVPLEAAYCSLMEPWLEAGLSQLHNLSNLPS